MGMLNSIKQVVSSIVKAPSFIVSRSAPWHDQTYVVDSRNYLDQFESWTYKAIKIKADALINYDQRFMKDDKEIETTQSALLFDLRYPNDFMSYNELRKTFVYHMCLTGEAAWLMTESERKGHKADFYPLDPTKLKYKVDAFGLPSVYVYVDANGEDQLIDPKNIIIFKNPNPKNFLKGFGELQGSRYAHNTYEFMLKFNMNWFGNSGRPEGFMIFEGAHDDQVAKLEDQLKQKYSGTRNSRRVGVLNKKFEYIELMKTQKDLDFSQGMINMRDEILALQGVPKTLAGLDDASFANAEQALRIFQMYTLAPLLQIEEDVYNGQLLPKYGEKMKGVFKHDDCVDIDAQKVATVQALLYEKGIVTQNEARRAVGLEDTEGGDSFYSAPAPDPLLLPSGDEESKKLNASIEAMQKSIEAQNNLIRNLPDVKEQLENVREQMKAFYLEKNISGEKKVVAELNKFFEAQEDRILKQVFKSKSKAINMDYKVDWVKEVELMFSFMRDPYIKESMKWNEIANDVTNAKVEYNKDIQEKIMRSLKKMTTKVSATTKDDLARTIANAIENNYTLDETKGAIKKLFEGYKFGSDKEKDSRSESIARTEVNSIKNETARWNYGQNEHVKGFDWLDAADPYVREEHRHVKSVVKGQKFKVGDEYLEYPGDKAGSPENIINCRCTTVPILLEA